MNIDTQLLFNILKYPISGTSRRYIKDFCRAKKMEVHLIMTLLVKNEEDIIEKNIRFHKAMGVDGFIVTSHNSTDRTDDILEKLKNEGLVLEIIKKTDVKFSQKDWVNDMINIARNKYKANWVINADADEFYYSNDLDLKKSIQKNFGANILWVDSIFAFPSCDDDFLNSPYYIPRTIKKFEADMLGVSDNIFCKDIMREYLCPKVIHKTKGFLSIVMGNHNVFLKKEVKVHCADIRLYHFSIRNYKGWEDKVKRFIDVVSLSEKEECIHVKEMIRIFKNNKLKEEFNKMYNNEVLQKLLDKGIAVKDYSLSIFMKYKGI